LIFQTLYTRLERSRWNMDDLDFSHIDRSKVDEALINDIYHVCMTELGSLPATKMFLRDFGHSADFQRFLSVWSFEEGKHSLALEKWLNANNVFLEETEVNKVLMDFAPAPWINTLTMHFLGEQRLGMWYAAFSGIGTGAKDSNKVLPEPVLRQILELMAQDEWRHAGAYFAFLKEAVASEPAHLLNIAKMTLWMLRGKYRHPTNITEPSVMDVLPDPEYHINLIDRYLTPAAEAAMEKRVLNCISILANTEISDVRGLVRFMKNRFGSASTQDTKLEPPLPLLS